MEDTENNTAIQEDIGSDDYEFHYNFITMPWDERTRTSKLSIVALLTAIFIAILGIVFNNFIIHYRGFNAQLLNADTKIDCNLVKVDMYQYVARIHSVVNLELICVGAVLSKSSVLAHELCLKSGSVRLHLGSPIDPQCKKGFPVDVFEAIPHEGVVTKALVLLSSYEDMSKCGSIISIAEQINAKSKAYIIGRPFRGGRSLSFQIATIAQKSDNVSIEWRNNLKRNNVICVKDLKKCPVRAGDLLVQGGHLIGLASTSSKDGGATTIACFANLSLVHGEIKLLDLKVD
ncbi:uncharacterized protein LOC119830555 [Zerene cesonia]|uniref:uncharacterized protein LOC119830555 n=1 Tax=Zerene cesonia TaxID=33412 RepID=UPI0018E4E522|nr:uncharacterized protein LOC119830555 [Zerene cesonia]